MSENERMFSKGHVACCNRCDKRFVLPKEVRAVRDGERAWRIMDFVMAPCGHLDCHWLFESDLARGTFHRITFSPLASNVLDYVDKPLGTFLGAEIVVRRRGNQFEVTMRTGGSLEVLCRSDSNWDVSHILNDMEVGIWQK